MRILATLLLAGAGLAAGCSDGGPGAPGTNEIFVQDNSFAPGAKTVAVGSTVKWIWRGAGAHNVTFGAGVASPTQSTGSYSRLFDTPGTFPYTCTIHGDAMSGTITVSAGEGSAAANRITGSE